MSRAARPLRPIIQVTSPLFPIAWPPLSGHFPQSPPRQLRRHHRSPLRQSSKVGLAAALFCLLHTSILPLKRPVLQPGSPDPVYEYAYSTKYCCFCRCCSRCHLLAQSVCTYTSPSFKNIWSTCRLLFPVTSKGATHWLHVLHIPPLADSLTACTTYCRTHTHCTHTHC